MSNVELRPEAQAASIAKARYDGFAVIFGDSHHLLLDLDSKEALAHYESFKELFKDLELSEEARWSSKTPGHLHVMVYSPDPLCSMTRIALQACLGSDLKHEALSILSVLKPTVLFKPTAF